MLLDGRLVLNHPRIGIIAHHFDHATIPGLNVSAAVSWDTHKFVVPNRIHLFRSGRVDGLTGRMDHSDAVKDLHRETRDRLGPNPHWPVCHRFGPRFIIICHPSYSSGQFIYPQTPLRYEDPVMQISGTGHWFLEGWIGDHSVDFLVDSGSSVTAMSDIFY